MSSNASLCPQICRCRRENNDLRWRQMSTKKNARNPCGFWRFAGKRYKLSAWRTEVRDGRPSDRISSGPPHRHSCFCAQPESPILLKKRWSVWRLRCASSEFLSRYCMTYKSFNFWDESRALLRPSYMSFSKKPNEIISHHQKSVNRIHPFVSKRMDRPNGAAVVLQILLSGYGNRRLGQRVWLPWPAPIRGKRPWLLRIIR